MRPLFGKSSEIVMGERDVVGGTLKYASLAVEKLEGECE